MASVETTTIRVRRSTHERLQKQAELTGQSVTQVLEEAADLLEEAKFMETVEDHFKQMAERTPEEIASAQARDEEWVCELEALPPYPRKD